MSAAASSTRVIDYAAESIGTIVKVRTTSHRDGTQKARRLHTFGHVLTFTCVVGAGFSRASLVGFQNLGTLF